MPYQSSNFAVCRVKDHVVGWGFGEGGGVDHVAYPRPPPSLWPDAAWFCLLHSPPSPPPLSIQCVVPKRRISGADSQCQQCHPWLISFHALGANAHHTCLLLWKGGGGFQDLRGPMTWWLFSAFDCFGGTSIPNIPNYRRWFFDASIFAFRELCHFRLRSPAMSVFLLFREVFWTNIYLQSKRNM